MSRLVQPGTLFVGGLRASAVRAMRLVPSEAEVLTTSPLELARRVSEAEWILLQSSVEAEGLYAEPVLAVVPESAKGFGPGRLLHFARVQLLHVCEMLEVATRVREGEEAQDLGYNYRQRLAVALACMREARELLARKTVNPASARLI